MRIIILLIVLLFSVPSWGAVIFEDNFNSQTDWTVLQPSSSSEGCSSGCTVPTGWHYYYNGFCRCDNALPDEPGNNNMYVYTGAGYPDNSTGCYGGSGKCVTYWQESCDAQTENSDGSLYVDLQQEYPEIYFQFRIKFKSGWERRAQDAGLGGALQKLYHLQHYDPAGSAPWVYHGVGPTNQPVASGGLTEYSTLLEFYAENRCQTTYDCHGVTVWSLGTLTAAYQAGGLYDGDWHLIEIRHKMNTSVGVADGIMELWVDGTKINPYPGYTNTDYNYNDSGETRGWRVLGIGGNTNNQFDTSCSSVADCEQWYSIDNVVISTTYIGPDYVIGGKRTLFRR